MISCQPSSPGRDDVGAVIVGGGAAGVCAGVRLGQLGVRYVLLEKSADGLGGAWRNNSYPGCVADTASHTLSFSFFPNPGFRGTHPTQVHSPVFLLLTLRVFLCCCSLSC